jgi:uncharacterized peroxidase-related enzyme
MPRFPSLPETPHLSDVFRRFPRGVRPLLEYHDVLLRGPSPLSVAERELLAAYVSGLNACGFCFGAHQQIAAVHGVEPGLLERLVADPASAGVEAKLLPLLAYVKALTESPSSIRPAHAEAVFAAGWDEDALYDAVSVCALFNFMNRLVEGTGVVTSPEVQAAQRERHQNLEAGDPRETYLEFGRRIGVVE